MMLMGSNATSSPTTNDDIRDRPIRLAINTASGADSAPRHADASRPAKRNGDRSEKYCARKSAKLFQTPISRPNANITTNDAALM
jgi:hypothetical protein